MKTVSFEPVIGLEVHAELLTQSKMFCACPVVDTSQAEPNSAVCEVCTGMPGTLPAINARAVEFALRAALALHCQVAETSLFARKNYFYPDLPKGYQISQYELPLARLGWLEFDTPTGARRVTIRRVHLEEDTGKLFHRQGASLVDYNRSGVPLLEVVTEPELYSLDDVKAYATALRSLLRYLDITTADMEKGAIRFEANVSVRPAGSASLGTRTEIKNLNSFRSMLRALEYEIARHSRILAQGGQVQQETLRWDDARGETYPERGKEEADDYRYFPEPDLPPLVIEPAWLQQISASLPELPGAKRARFIEHYRLSPYTAGVLTAERAVADFFEAALAAAPDLPPAKLANWLSGDLFALLNEHGQTIEQGKVGPSQLAELVQLVEQGRLNTTSAKAVLAEAFASGDTPALIADRRGLSQLSDRGEIERLVRDVIAAHPQQVQQYLGGKTAIAEWLVGQVMRAAGGRANPALVRHSLQLQLQALEESRRGP
ncbi:MAG: Asp-tRNA(Asn)/Glu-tRNA(Gln) amidotransferase subunit GatB [Chloroflexota bacterium]